MFLRKTNQNKFFIHLSFLLFFSFFFFTGYGQNGVAINTTGNSADASAILDLTDLTISKGLLLPQVSSTGSVNSPATGLIVYQTNSLAGIYCNIGTKASPNWIQLSSSSGNGNYILNQNGSIQTPGTFNIAGTGALVGLTNTNSLTSYGGAINLNANATNSTFATNINTNGDGTVTIGGSGGQTINLGASIAGNGAINIGSSIGGNAAVNIGSTNGNNSVTILAGSGGIKFGNASSANIFIPKFSAIGSLLYTSAAAGQIGAITPGSSGTVLTSNGTGNAPTWSTPTTGTVTGSGAIPHLTA